MTAKELGEQTAAPIDAKDGIWHYYGGLTKREWLAGLALGAVVNTGSIATVEKAAKSLGIPVENYETEIHWPMLCAKEAVQMADALLTELVKGQNDTSRID